MGEKSIAIVVIVVFIIVGAFYIWRDYHQFVSNIVHPSATPVTTNIYQGTDVQIKNLYKNPF